LKVAVLGSGAGGCGVAHDFASHGHAVRLWDAEQFPDTVAAVAERGGIDADGDLQGFAPVTYAGHDIARAIGDADLVLAVGPAYSTKPFAEACRPNLRAGQTVVVCPGSCGGAIEFKRAIGLDLRDPSILVAETSTLPYAVRITGPARIHVYLKLVAGLTLAALPASETENVLSAVADVYPAMGPALNVFETTLQNANPVIHPAITLCNAAQIERTGGDLFFYEDGCTPSVARLVEAVDRERQALGTAFGVKVPPDPDIGFAQGYMTQKTYYPGYMTAPGFRGIKAQSSLDHRYFNEDVGYGLVFLCDLGRRTGVPTPAMDAILTITSVLRGRDYAAEGRRTMKSLGLDGLSLAELVALVS
jgi:opine dehydrogenase